VTVLSSETRLVGTGTPLLPRVNLLPPEIAEKAAFRRIQMGLGAALLLPVVVVGALYTSASHSVTSAQDRINAADSASVRLTAQTAKYRDVTAVYAAAAAAKTQLTTAMGDEIRFSQMMNDLSLSVPSNVWLTNLAFTTTAPSAAAASVAATGVGAVTVSATAFSHDDVAVWLESLAKLKTYQDPYFSNSTEALIGTRKVVNFTSTATLTQAARSGRYTTPAGG
jgi:Tfp pilus assembly protein PilN